MQMPLPPVTDEPPSHGTDHRQRLLFIALHLVVLVALALLPGFAGKYYVQFAAKVMIMGMLAMSLDLLLGYTGLVSFGHGAFYGVGAYVLAMLTPPYQAAGFWTSFPLAILAAALVALVIGCLVVRTHGIYFIMVTLAFAQMLFFLFHDTRIAGGNDGIYIDVRPDATILGWKPFDLENFVHVYFVVLGLFVISYLLLRLILRSSFGHALVGIRVNEHRMRSLGHRTFAAKLAAFVIAGAIAGAAGYLSAVQFGVVNPEFMGWHLSAALMMMVILGGMGTLAGAALGAAAWMLLELGFQSLPTLGSVDLGKHWQLWMGGFIVLATLALPEGLLGLLARLRRKPAALDPTPTAGTPGDDARGRP
jgi:branched-chain amino acid transport system permease protein